MPRPLLGDPRRPERRQRVVNGREQRKKRAQRARDAQPIRRGTRDPFGGLCPNGCGEPGPHFIPPSLGDRGFFTCTPAHRRSNTVSNLPSYVYVASSWRNPMQPAVIEVLRAAGIDCYDFRNPDGGTGFSWSEVKGPDAEPSRPHCEHCGTAIVRSTFAALGRWEPDYDPADDLEKWRHVATGYAACVTNASKFAIPKKGSDWESQAEYLSMIEHPRAIEGYGADFAAMQKADTFVMVLPCGKSAHLELGWAVGAGKRTAILLEDPVEPELMYRMVDHLATSVIDLLGWMGVED